MISEIQNYIVKKVEYKYPTFSLYLKFVLEQYNYINMIY